MTLYDNLMAANHNMVKKLVTKSSVDESLVQNFVYFARTLIKPELGAIDKPVFAAVMANYFEIIDLNYVFRTYDCMVKRNKRGVVGMSVEDFAWCLCVFYTSDTDIKIDYIFDIYDTNGDGLLEMRELHMAMRSCKCASDVDEGERQETYSDLCVMLIDLMGIATKPMDREGFRAKVHENSPMLHILGRLLPPEHASIRFKEKIKGKTNLQMKATFGNIRAKLLHELPTEDKLKIFPIPLDLP